MSNKYLILMRHAEAVDAKPGQNDRLRKLTPEGHRQAFEAAVLLKKCGFIPQQVLLSPALRTEETCADMGDAWETNPQLIRDEIIYNVSHGISPFNQEFDLVATFNDVLANADPNASCIMILGHNPAIANLVHTVGNNLPYDLTIKYPTATATVLRLPSNTWSSLQDNQCVCEKVAFNGTRLIDAAPAP